jgi:hypothetical protein
VFYCGKSAAGKRNGKSAPKSGGNTVQAVTITFKADPFGVRKLKEINTLEPLTLMGIFAGYFNYVMALFAVFLITAKR